MQDMVALLGIPALVKFTSIGAALAPSTCTILDVEPLTPKYTRFVVKGETVTAVTSIPLKLGMVTVEEEDPV